MSPLSFFREQNLFTVAKDGKTVILLSAWQDCITCPEKRWYREISSIRPFIDGWSFLFVQVSKH
jgi:valyl-tRNA synthetase